MFLCVGIYKLVYAFFSFFADCISSHGLMKGCSNVSFWIFPLDSLFIPVTPPLGRSCSVQSLQYGDISATLESR